MCSKFNSVSALLSASQISSCPHHSRGLAQSQVCLCGYSINVCPPHKSWELTCFFSLTSWLWAGTTWYQFVEWGKKMPHLLGAKLLWSRSSQPRPRGGSRDGHSRLENGSIYLPVHKRYGCATSVCVCVFTSNILTCKHHP